MANMDEIEAMMVELHKRHGNEAMKAIATMMHDLGSETTIEFADGTWVPCDFLMQMAWANGGSPSPVECELPFSRLPVCGCDPGTGSVPTKAKMAECRLQGGPCSPTWSGANEPQDQ